MFTYRKENSYTSRKKVHTLVKQDANSDKDWIYVLSVYSTGRYWEYMRRMYTGQRPRGSRQKKLYNTNTRNLDTHLLFQISAKSKLSWKHRRGDNQTLQEQLLIHCGLCVVTLIFLPAVIGFQNWITTYSS